MRCLDVRLQLVSYLTDSLEVVNSERIREHLHECSSCREYMLKNEMVERVEMSPDATPGSDFSRRVLAVVAPSQALRPLTKLFIGVCSAAVMFAVAVFTYLRYYLTPGDLEAVSGAEVLTPPSAWPEQLLGLAQTPLVRYSLYAAGAVLIAVLLIALVDFGRQPLDLKQTDVAAARAAGNVSDR